LDGHGDFATNDRENPGRSEQLLAEWQRHAGVGNGICAAAARGVRNSASARALAAALDLRALRARYDGLR
jgi:hypothetical protein